MAGRMRALLLSGLLAAGCAAPRPAASETSPPATPATPVPALRAASPAPAASAVPAASPNPALAAACPVTKPVPPEAIPPAAARPIVAGYLGPPGGLRLSMYGNDALWVVIPPDGETAGVPGPDGVFDKFPTVRLVEGKLSAEARRIDGLAPPAQVSIPDGYGPIGFQSFGVTFPTEGCWEIAQQVAGRALLFVVKVRRTTP